MRDRQVTEIHLKSFGKFRHYRSENRAVFIQGGHTVKD